MKRLLLFLLLISSVTYGQISQPNVFPQFQQFGSPSTWTRINGALYAFSGIVNAEFADTTAANLSSIRLAPGAQIRTGSKLWLRNSTATLWIEFTTGGAQVYPAAGIAVSTGSAWTTSIVNNSANWNIAFTDRLKWDGGSTGLVAATGRTSLGATTVGSNFFTLTNPSAITFPRINADNSVSALNASDFRTAIGASAGSDMNKYRLGQFKTSSFVFDDFDTTSTSLNGRVTPTGQTWSVAGTATANNGTYSTINNTYATLDYGSAIKRIGATFTFASTSSQVGIHADKLAGVLDDMIHTIINPQSWTLQKRLAGGAFVTIAGGVWGIPLRTDGTVYAFSYTISGNTVTVTDCMGDVTSVTDTDIGVIAPRYGVFQIGNLDFTAKFKSVIMDNGSVSESWRAYGNGADLRDLDLFYGQGLTKRRKITGTVTGAGWYRISTESALGTFAIAGNVKITASDVATRNVYWDVDVNTFTGSTVNPRLVQNYAYNYSSPITQIRLSRDDASPFGIGLDIFIPNGDAVTYSIEFNGGFTPVSSPVVGATAYPSFSNTITITETNNKLLDVLGGNNAGLTLNANGTNQSVTLTPTGTGKSVLGGIVNIPTVPTTSASAYDIFVRKQSNGDGEIIPSTTFQVAGAAWNTIGNSGTNPATHWFGTNDAQPIVVKINGTETARFGIASGTTNNLLINSTAAPSSQLKITSGGAGAFSVTNYSADNVFIGFDMDYENTGGFIARHTSASYIQKTGAKLVFTGNTGLTSGVAYTPAALMTLDLANGNFGVGVSAPAAKVNIIAAQSTTVNDLMFTYDASAQYRNGIANTFAGGTPAANIMTFLVGDGTPTGQVSPLDLRGNRIAYFYGRLEMQQGADVASVAGAIAVGLDGNTFELTGTNAVTLISNLNWVNGSEITFVFTSTATLTDGTANSGTDIGMELAGNANFVGSADDVITLVLTEIGGTQRWREKSRSVN